MGMCKFYGLFDSIQPIRVSIAFLTCSNYHKS